VTVKTLMILDFRFQLLTFYLSKKM